MAQRDTLKRAAWVADRKVDPRADAVGTVFPASACAAGCGVWSRRVASNRSTSTTPARLSARAPRPRARRAVNGDIAPSLTLRGIEGFTVTRAAEAAREAKVTAVDDIIQGPHAVERPQLVESLQAIVDGASPDEAAVLRRALRDKARLARREGADADTALADNWQDGGYPYKNLLSRKSYERQKYRLQVELLKLQSWVKETGQRVIVLFEGRDAAGKGGTIRRFMEHLNPRGARVVALEKPTDEERGQWYFQRYVEHLPTSGEIVLFDR